MKHYTIPICLLIATAAHGQVRMVVLVKGRRAGTATLSQRLTEKGAKVVDMTIEIKSGDDNVKIQSERTYDPNGAPTRMVQQVTVTGKDHSHDETTVTFDDDGANVVIDDDDDRSTKHIPLLASNPREDASEYWFVRDQPVVGETVVSYSLQHRYVGVGAGHHDHLKGMRPVTADGRREIANVVTSEQGSAFLDINGRPLRLELPNSAMERQWDK